MSSFSFCLSCGFQGRRGVLARAFVASGESHSEPKRAKRLRMQAVVYLKLGTRQSNKAHMTQTKQYTERNLSTVGKTDNMLCVGTADRGAGGEIEEEVRASANGQNKSFKHGY